MTFPSGGYTSVAAAQSDGLQHYWSLDEASGTTAADEVGGVDITVTGDSGDDSIQAGLLSNCRDITNNGQGGNAVLPVPSGVDSNGAGWAVSVWFWLPSGHTYNGYDTLLDLSNYSYGGIKVFTNSNGTLQVDNETTYDSFSVGAGTLNAWNHLLVSQTWDGQYSAWLNGVDQSAPSGTASDIDSSVGTLHLGSEDGSSKHWPGKIDEVGIFYREATATDATNIYNSGAGVRLVQVGSDIEGFVVEGLGVDGTLLELLPETVTELFGLSETALTASINEDAEASLAFSDSQMVEATLSIANVLELIGAVEHEWAETVVEALEVLVSHSTPLDATQPLADTLALASRLSAAFTSLISEDAAFSLSEALAITAQVADSLAISGVHGSEASAVALVAAALAFADATESGDDVEVDEVLELAHAYAHVLSANTSLDEGLGVNGTLFIFASLSSDVEEGVTAGDAISLSQVLQALVSEEPAFSSAVSLGDAVYGAWVMNAKNLSGTTRYTNYAYNSFATMGGTVLGAKDDGIYSLEASTEDGENIDALVRTGLSDFRKSQKKSIPELFLGTTGGGKLVLKAVTSDGSTKTEAWYEVRASDTRVDGNARAKIGRGLRGAYWQFELLSVDGSELNIDNIEFTPALLQRRL